MTWNEIRTYYPQQWLLLEAIKAHSTQNRRLVATAGRLAVLNTFSDFIPIVNS